MGFTTDIKNITKTSLNSSVANAINVAGKVGNALLHNVAPDNYEYYMCSLELLDYDGNQQGFLSFTVMPNNMSESRTPIQTQTKTKNGIITIFNNSFNPVVLNLSGTFGRKFRLLTNVISPTENKNFFDLNFGKILPETKVVSGYGMIRILKFILDKANQLDNLERPYFLVFSNYALNTSYVVDVVNYTLTQSLENNMLWFYDLQLKGIAPGSAISSNNNLDVKQIASDSIMQSLGNIISDINRNLSSNYNNSIL